MTAEMHEAVMAGTDGGTEGFDPERGHVDLHYVGWDSLNEDVRLWVGQYASADDCAITLHGPGDTSVVLRCSRRQLTRWHAEVGRMLLRADTEVLGVIAKEMWSL